MALQKLEWQVTEVDGCYLLAIVEKGTLRTPTMEEAQRAMRMLNEEGNTVVRLLCHNPECKDKGGWIERTRMQAEKMTFACDSCGKKMER